MPPEGLEQPPNTSEKVGILQYSGAESGALQTALSLNDVDFQTVVAHWPNLPDEIKAGILAMVRAVSSSSESQILE